MSTSSADPHFYWKHASQELRGLQDRITAYKRRFEDVGRRDISDSLEEAIRLLMEAQRAAEQIARGH
jgi:hypothetical protein